MQSVHHNETLVLARVRTGDQPLPKRLGKDQGVFPYIYQREEPHPPCVMLDTHVDPAEVNYEVPLKAEAEAAVQHIRPYRAGGHTHHCAEHFKHWRREA